MGKAWRPVSRTEPCRYCGKSDWCRVRVDGTWVLCRRVDTGEGVQKTDKAGAEYWLYRLESPSAGARPFDEPPPFGHPTGAQPATLDRVYRALLSLLPLTPRHREDLHRRGLTDHEIAWRHYRSLLQVGRAALARALLSRFGPRLCAGVPGL
jgi:hypothetical protein